MMEVVLQTTSRGVSGISYVGGEFIGVYTDKGKSEVLEFEEEGDAIKAGQAAGGPVEIRPCSYSLTASTSRASCSNASGSVLSESNRSSE